MHFLVLPVTTTKEFKDSLENVSTYFIQGRCEQIIIKVGWTNNLVEACIFENSDLTFEMEWLGDLGVNLDRLDKQIQELYSKIIVMLSQGNCTSDQDQIWQRR